MQNMNETNQSTALPTGTKKNQAKEFFSSLPSKLRPMWQDYGYLLFAGLIPAMIFFLIYLARGMYPFGDGTVLVLDLNGQYVYFFEELRTNIFTGQSLLYSWSRALGGEFMGIYAYYIASPLSYIVCLFPQDNIQEALLVMFLIKSAICGLTMAFFLHKHSEKQNKITIIGFSILYAVCAYCVVQQHNTMWIDVAMWLPLLTYGIERLVKYGKFGMFTFFLALSIMSNYYIGYMVCIYVVAYYFYYIFAKWENHENNPRYEKLHFWKSLFRTFCFSILACGIAMVIILCAYYSLTFGKTEFSDPKWEITLRADVIEVLYKFLPGSYDTVRPQGMPFIYCGILTLIMIPAYFASRKFNAREKIGAGVFVAFFIGSMLISTADLIWHGFQKPNWLNNRYSFMLCFFMVYLAFLAFESLEKVSRRTTIFSAALIGGFAIVIQKLAEQMKEENKYIVIDDWATVVLTLVCLGLYLAVIAAMRHAKNKHIIAIIMVCVISVEVFLSGLSNLNDLAADVAFTKHYKYTEFQDLLRPVTETLNEHDKTFYRAEKTLHRKTNDNMALDLRGVSNSTSTLHKPAINFLRYSGYAATSHWGKYLGGNPANDSIIGLKYIISNRDYTNLYGDPVLTEEDYARHEGMSVEELREKTFSDEYSDLSSNDMKVYYNPYHLSLAYCADDAVLDFVMKEQQTNDSSKESYCEDGYAIHFDRLNALYAAILGLDAPVEIFKPATQMGNPAIKDCTFKVSSEHNKYENEKDKEGSVTYTYSIPQEAIDNGYQLYLSLPAYYAREVKLSMPGGVFDGSSKYGTGENYRIIDIGKAEKEEIQFTIKITNDSDLFYTKLLDSFVYYADMDVLKTATEQIQAHQLVIDEEYKEDDISGTITTPKDDQLIMTSIPYDEGWQIYVDGELVEHIEICDALMGFRIDDAGEHTIRFKYSPSCFRYGLVISIVCTILFLVLLVAAPFLAKLPVIRSVYAVPDLAPVAREDAESTHTRHTEHSDGEDEDGSHRKQKKINKNKKNK